MMGDALWITVIAVAGGLTAVLGWKVLDIGKRAMELERGDRPTQRGETPS